MALAGIRLDDGRGSFASNCFPVRPGFGKTSDEANGAWLIAHHAEQRRRFKAVLCTKPLTYSRIKEERKKSELEGTKLDHHKFEVADDQEDDIDEEKVLDGFFLMKHCCIDDPADLCSLNIAGKELTDVKEDDLALFENVAYVNAGENYLPFEAFRGFPSLRELEMPLNGLRSLHIDYTDFSSLEMLDLSYNNLSQEDLLTLGLLSHLKVLHLTGNHFRLLPQDMAMPYLSREKNVRLPRFSKLEVLLLDDNNLQEMNIFAALAGLPKLRHLNLSKNEIFFVPQLKCVEGRVVTQDGKNKRRRNRPSSGRRSSRRSRSRLGQEMPLVDLEIKSETPAPDKGHADLKIDGNAGGNKTDSLDKTGTQVTSTEESTLKGQGSAMDTEWDKLPVLPDIPDFPDLPDLANIPLQDLESTLDQMGIPGDLLAKDFTSDNLTSRISDLEGDLKPEEPEPEKSVPSLPPFPELRYLNLSYNKICEEDGLLAVAAWPMLMELDIYKNPLTTENSGDPPLLKRFLQDRLRIKLNRKKPDEVITFQKAPKVEIRPKNIKIQEVVPKVPRLTVEEKMRLELPPPAATHAIEHGSSPVMGDRHHAGPKKISVLPPIPTTPKEELTEAWTETLVEEDEEEYDADEDDNDDQARAPSGSSDTFFMTQPDDIEAKPKPRTNEATKKRTKKASKGSKSSDFELDDKYKGYELLLEIDELENEPDLPPATDVQGNIRALKHTLAHQLVYRDPAVELSKVKKYVQEYRRAPVPPAQPHQSYQERMDSALHNLKTRSIVEEEKLTSVLKDRAALRKQFPDAEDLLGKIQRKYNAVRVHSMQKKDTKDAKKITDSIIKSIPEPRKVGGK